jgi:ubiquinone/menaquinone biosynthesis C-methylase UbiE
VSTRLDPEEREVTALFAAASFRDARVLEIGSGDGRLARRYAASAARVVGIEPNAQYVAKAARDCAAAFPGSVFIRGDATRLPVRSRAFDVALFGWSL